MTAPLIAIPTYHLGPGQVGNWQGAYALPEPYVAALRAAGARTALLPPSQPAEPEEVLGPFDGLLLAIEPARYGAAAHPAQYGTDPDRDQLELALVREAVRLGIPTLGICRGVQLLNVAFGGTLVQHLPELPGRGPTADMTGRALAMVQHEPGQDSVYLAAFVEANVPVSVPEPSRFGTPGCGSWGPGPSGSYSPAL